MDRRLEVRKNRTPREIILVGHVDRVTGMLDAMNGGAAFLRRGKLGPLGPMQGGANGHAMVEASSL
jgi:hypothetical protein